MKQIFIDKFIVPKSAIEEFLQKMNYNRNFIKNIQGCDSNTGYERTDENGNLIAITIVVWESEDALNKAKEVVQAEYNRINFNPAEMMSRLNITIDRGIYTEIED